MSFASWQALYQSDLQGAVAVVVVAAHMEDVADRRDEQ